MIVVFLGPSLASGTAAQLLPGAELRPPAAMGDVLDAVHDGAACIALIDGVFEHTPAVWHREITYALSRGVAVWGASSMGALRAAELHALGMRGVGRVFELLRDGVIERDDEVALLHAPAGSGYRALSEPLINIRLALVDAVAEGVLASDDAAALLAVVDRCYYPERSWDVVLAAARRLLAPQEARRLTEWLVHTAPDAKRDDAVALLKRLARADTSIGGAPAWRFPDTWHWQQVLAISANPIRPERASSIPRALR